MDEIIPYIILILVLLVLELIQSVWAKSKIKKWILPILSFLLSVYIMIYLISFELASAFSVKNITEYLEKGVSFNQETTLCGNMIVKNILKAKSLGYFIELHYVGVDSVEIAKERVKYRVQQGGHGIPERDIEKRYEETFKQLNFILKECNLVAFYDNTESFRRFAKRD